MKTSAKFAICFTRLKSFVIPTRFKANASLSIELHNHAFG